MMRMLSTPNCCRTSAPAGERDRERETERGRQREGEER